MRFGSRTILVLSLGFIISGVAVWAVMERETLVQVSNGLQGLKSVEGRSPDAIQRTAAVEMSDSTRRKLIEQIDEAEQLIEKYKQGGAREVALLERALDLEFNSCAGGDSRGCNLGFHRAQLHPNSQYSEQITKLMKQTCRDDKNYDVCIIYGQSLISVGNVGDGIRVMSETCSTGSHGTSCAAAADALKAANRLDEAHAYALRGCQANGESCAWTLRSFPTHPELATIRSKAEEHCRTSSAFGMSGCKLLAIHYAKNKDFESALSVLDFDCKRENGSSCVLASALLLSHGDRTAAVKALKEWCPVGLTGVYERDMVDFSQGACSTLKKGNVLSKAQSKYLANLASTYLKETN